MTHAHVLIRLTALFFLILLVGAELGARALGHRPSIADDPALWSMERDRLDSSDQAHVTVLGASRMLYGIDLDVVHESFPRHEVFLLAISGASPLPVLEDLVRSPPPPGLLIVSMAGPLLERQAVADGRRYVAFRQAHWGAPQKWERRLRSLLQERLALLRQGMDPRAVLAQWARFGAFPGPDAPEIDRRRSIAAPRSILERTVTGEAGRRKVTRSLDDRVGNHVSEEQWRHDVGQMLALTDILGEHGTRTVFVAMPLAGPFEALESELYPRDRYWGYLEQACSSGRCGTLDTAGLTPFDPFRPADYSHLAAEDKEGFTRVLMHYLRNDPAMTD